MRRMMFLLLVLCLASLPVCAETRERVIELEGQEERITEELFESDLGFSFWYDAEWLEVAADASGAGLCVRPADGGGLIRLEMLPSEAVGTGAWEFISVHASDDTVVRFEDLESGAEMAWFFLASEDSPEVMHGYYLVTMDMEEEDENAPWMAATATFPLEAAEGAGNRLTALMRTVAFEAWTPSPQAGMPVRAAWAEDLLDSRTAYMSWNLVGSDSWVLFTAEEPVTNFRILELTLQFTGDGDYTYHESEAFALDAFWPSTPVIAGLDFPGDAPCWGIAYTDDAWEERRYTVEISGEDGSILLLPY